MKWTVFLVVFLCPLSMALAQPVSGGASSGKSTTFTASAGSGAAAFKMSQGATICADNTGCATTAGADATTDGWKHVANVTNSGSNQAHTFDTAGAITGSTLLGAFANNGTNKFTIDNAGGIVISTTANNQAIKIIQSAKLCLNSNGGSPCSLNMQDNGSGELNLNGNGLNVVANKLTANSDYAVTLHHSQSSAASSVEFGKAAATANSLAVTFATAFSAAPACTCADNNANPTGCGISTAATTGGVTFTGTTGATDNVSWICIGLR